MTNTKAKMKQHLEAGLDITAQVSWVNHLGQSVPARVTRVERDGSRPAYWEVRDLAGRPLSAGSGGSLFTFSY